MNARSMTRSALAGLLALLGAAIAAPLAAHPGHDKPAAEPADSGITALELEPNREREYFTDLELVDQDGRTVRFYSDVLRDRIVLINFIYTDCPDFCPMLTRKLKDVRARIDAKVSGDITFVSLSTNPARDTPEVLQEFIRQNGVEEDGNWLFLTGEEDRVRAVLRRLGETAQEPAGHSTLLLAGNVNGRNWAKIMPHSPPVAIALKLEELAGLALPHAQH